MSSLALLKTNSDIVDVNAQMEVQQLQIKILKEALQEKEKEIDEERRLAAEWKKRAFERVKNVNEITTKAIVGSPEYMVMIVGAVVAVMIMGMVVMV